MWTHGSKSITDYVNQDSYFTFSQEGCINDQPIKCLVHDKRLFCSSGWFLELLNFEFELCDLMIQMRYNMKIINI